MTDPPTAQCDKKSSLVVQHATFIYNCTIEVITDAMSKPTYGTLICRAEDRSLDNTCIVALGTQEVKIPPRQKLASVDIFSLIVIVMAISIVRLAIIQTSDHRNADQTWLSI